MAERGFTDPVRVADVEESHQSVRKSRLENHELTLIMYGGILGVTVTLLFGIGLIVIGVIDG